MSELVVNGVMCGLGVVSVAFTAHRVHTQSKGEGAILALDALQEALEMDPMTKKGAGVFREATFDAVGAVDGMMVRVALEQRVGLVEWGVGLGVRGARLCAVGARGDMEDVLKVEEVSGEPFKTGDAAFDKAFEVVGGEDTGAVARVLGAGLRAQLMERASGWVCVEEREFRVVWERDAVLLDPVGCVEETKALALALRRAQVEASG